MHIPPVIWVNKTVTPQLKMIYCVQPTHYYYYRCTWASSITTLIPLPASFLWRSCQRASMVLKQNNGMIVTKITIREKKLPYRQDFCAHFFIMHICNLLFCVNNSVNKLTKFRSFTLLTKIIMARTSSFQA